MLAHRTPKDLISFNGKISYYPDGRNKLVVASKPIFLAEGWESSEYHEKVPKPQEKDNEVRPDSVLRAQHKVFDIARLNSFDYFITWTLDKEQIDRYDPAVVAKKLKTFLNNMMKRKNLKYLIIPEYHKDSAIHIHGLISGDFDLIDSSKRTKNNQIIYNMPDWSYGWSTAIQLDGNVGAISNYITKYISKDFRKIFGNFYYAGGHGLVRKPPTELIDINYHDIDTKEYTKFGCGFKYVELGDYTLTDNLTSGNLIVSENE